VKPRVKSADLLTGLRIPLAVAFPFLPDPAWRLAIVGVVALTDVLDGWLARRYGGSRLGAILDPIADKLFMVSAFLTVAGSGLLTWWEMLGVLARDIVAGIAALWVWIGGRPRALPARAGGKAVTICQILTLVAFIAESPLVRPLAWATAAIAVYAIWDYGRVDARTGRHAAAGDGRT
jgi:CDP-diacylglycerol--glycerol-3-phosphate 3-phosphatidyltransferase/cardiolipin synthase